MKKINFTNLLVLCLMLFGTSAMAQTFTGSTGPVPVAGTSGTSTFTASVSGIGTLGAAAGTIDDLTIASLTHTFDGDLEIRLFSPSTTELLLSDNNGGGGDNYINTVFQDGGGDINAASAPFSGTFAPEGGTFAAAYDGEDANGDWTLEIMDLFAGDSGNMNEWSITLTAGAPPVATACDLQCPTPVIVATTDPGSACSAQVTIPQPLTSSECDLSTLTNDYNGTADASDEYPRGTTLVTYSIIDQGTGNPTTCTVEVIVQDNTPPTFTACPGDMTINLDAGECDVFVDFNIVAEDECNMQMFSLNQNTGVDDLCTNGNLGPTIVCATFTIDVIEYGRLFDLEALGLNSDFVLEDIDLGYSSTNGNPITVDIYTLPYGVTVPTVAALGAPIASETFNPALAAAITCGFFDLTDVSIPLGQNVFISVGAASNGFGGTVFSLDGNGEDAPTYANGCAVSIPGFFPDWTDIDGLGFTQGLNVQLNGATLGTEVPTVADPGNPFANGDALPIGGPYEFTYTAEDLAGNVSSCSFSVTIQEFPNPSTSLACNPEGIQISLDEDCQAVVGADDVLEGGQYGCYDDYLVELFFDQAMTQPLPTGNVLTSQNIGQIIYVQVTDPETGNNCWSSLIVEDKIIPELECTDVDVLCTDPIAPGTTIPSGTASASVTDGGTWASTGSFDNTFGISGAGTVTDVNVSLDITHTWVGDLVVTVTSPDGTTVTVLNGSCGNTDDVNVTFDDESANPFACGAGIPVLGGDLQPQNALSAFDDEIAAGDWVVNVSDNIGGDGGTINGITLEVGFSGTEVAFPLPAGATIAPFDIANGQPYTVIGFDPCGPTTLTFEDNESAGECTTDDFIRQITRTWTAVDASGNETTCDQIISVLRSTIDDVTFPLNRDGIELDYLECDGNFAVDANGLPSPTVTGFPQINGQDISSGDLCDFGLDYEDQVIDICEGTIKIIRTWTVLAWCPTTEIANDIQIIKVVDDQGPTIGGLADQVISTGQNDCTASAIIQTPALSDACSPTGLSYTVEVSQGTLNAAQTAVFGLELGQTTVTITAIDGCGNESVASYVITVVDQVPPVAICESFHTVGLTIDEPTLVPALVFDDGSYDNCELVEYQVRRMDNPDCPGFDGTPFGDFVPFYCCDVGGANVMVELRVRDASGNTNSCMVEVEVQDKLNPAIACPPNKVLDCWEDPFDLSLTGEATATDNCSATVTFFDNGDFDNCGEAEIFRIFTATDAGGRTASCVQRIDVINSEPFFICDNRPWNFPFVGCPSDPDGNTTSVAQHSNQDGVEWPADIELTTCGPGLLPEDLEGVVNINNVRPRIFEDVCDLVGVTFEDTPLPITPPACVKLIRKWIVYDWCTFDEDNFDPNNPTASEGYYEYVQIIKVLNSDAPTILSDCEDVSFCSFDPNCADGPATLTLEAEDDCTADEDLNYEYKIDAFNDGNFDITGFTNDASGDYPLGTHRIMWFVEDGCGNVSTCSYIFVVQDCKAPTPNVLNGIATDVMENCQIEVGAQHFDNPSSPSFDNCGIQEWRIVTPSQGPGQTVPPVGSTDAVIFTAPQDLGTQTVDIWILDVNGNWGYVSTYILIQDNVSPFCNGPSASIAGQVETEEAQMVESTLVQLTGGAPGVPELEEMMTEANGLYGFPGLATGGNYVVTPEKDINPLNGVSTFDLVKISQHILEVELLPSPYKVIAADVNNDGNVTTFDLIQLRRLILFIDTEFQNNTSWRFVEADFVFPNPQDPFETTFPEVYAVNNLTEQELADFIAVKIGDVNCSASPNSLVGGSEDRAAGELTLSVKDEALKAGETYTVDFSAKDFEAVYGYQFTLGFDSDAVEFEGIEAGTLTNLNDANFGMAMVNEGIITTSWNNSTAVTMDADAALFSVTFTANADAQLSDVISINSRYTKAEAYNGNGLLDVDVEFNNENGVTVAGGVFELYQNQPNPFKEETNISFNLPEAGFATLTIYDVSGKVLRAVEGDFAKGYNQVTINRSEIAGAGVLYYQLDTENDSATKKMILIK